jgi:hypothetical protein
MFCRERKIVCVGSERIIILMWNLKILALLLMMQKIRHIGEIWRKVFTWLIKFSCIYKCENGMVVENQVRDPKGHWFETCLCRLVFRWAWRIKRKIRLVLFFR